MPQEISRNEKAISFNKGCYLGQETIARIDALGHVNKQLCAVQFSGDKIPGVGLKLISGDQEVGRVTSTCWSPRFESPLGLAMIRRGSNDVGLELESEIGNATIIDPR